MNETMEILFNRCSVRTFTNQKIDRKIVDNILNAGLKAASAGNLQPISIIKIEDPKNSKCFVDWGMQSFIGKAPLNLLFCLDYNRIKKWSKNHKTPFVSDKSFRRFWVSFQDVVIAAQTIETAANSYGIGSVYIGSTVDLMPQIKERFKLPKGVIPVVLLTLGYPKGKKRIASKLSCDIVVHNEEYHDPSIEFIEEEYAKKYGKDNLELTEERKEYILEVVKAVDGEEKVAEAREYLKDKKFVERPTKYFCFNYPAFFMAHNNTKLFEYLSKEGLLWAELKDYPEDVSAFE